MEAAHCDPWHSAMTPQVKHREDRMIICDISNQVRGRKNCSGKRSLVTSSTPVRRANLRVLEDDCAQIVPALHQLEEEAPSCKHAFLSDDDPVPPSPAWLKSRLRRDLSTGFPHIRKERETSTKQAFFDEGTEPPPVDHFISPPDWGDRPAAVFEDPDGHGSSEQLAQALLKGTLRTCPETQPRDLVLAGDFDTVDCNSLASISPQQVSEMLTPDSMKDQIHFVIPPMHLDPVPFNVDFDFDSDGDECLMDTSGPQPHTMSISPLHGSALP